MPVSALQQLLEIPHDPATRLRASIENAFLRGFFRAELPSTYNFQPVDVDVLMDDLSRRGISETAIGTSLRAFNENPNFAAEDSHGAFSFHLDGTGEEGWLCSSRRYMQ